MENYGQSAMKSGYAHAGQALGPSANYDQSQAMQKRAAEIGPVPNRQSEQMFHEIGQRFGLLGELISRLEMLTDRACGSVPCDPKANGGRDVPSTLTDKISITIPMLDEANSRLMGAVQRLESFV